MLTIQQISDLPGSTVYDTDHSKIGKIGQIYLDDQTGRPEWVAVRTGLFGIHESFVPLAGAEMLSAEEVIVPVTKEAVKDAPRIDPNGAHLSEAEEMELYRYYGLPDQPTPAPGPVGHGTSGPATASGPTTDDAMTRSEEQLRVDIEQHETGRVRLRKYVVTEVVQQSVPVSRDEIRIEREPITEENRGQAMSGPAIKEEEHEVTLYEERPVVGIETVPVERVRLTKETVHDEETVQGAVRKEKIQAEGVDEGGRTS
ncbi:MAG: DUF2382 domain-containing protein [Pseudonocardiaceae bacterium]